MKAKTIFFFLFLSPFLLNAQHDCFDNIKEKVQYFDYDSSIIQLAEIDQFQAFLVGERHFIQDNIDLHSTLIHSLSKEKANQHVLIEFPPSMSFFIERYYQTKEEKWLDLAFEDVPFAEYHKELYKKIQQKTPNIKVIGYDLEVGGFRRVNRIISELNGILRSPQEFTIIVTFLNSFRNDQASMASAMTFQSLYHLTKKNKKKIKKAFRGNYIHFWKMMDNLKTFFPNKEEEIYDTTFQIRRDSLLFENIVKLQQQEHFDQCYIAAGSFHIEKTRAMNHPRLAHFLDQKTYSPFKNKVASIRLNYLGFTKDALGQELQFKQILDHSNLNEEEIDLLFSNTSQKIGVVPVFKSKYSCNENELFDYFIYLRPK